MLKKSAVFLIVFLSSLYFIILLNASDCEKAKNLIKEGNKTFSSNLSKAEELYRQAIKLCPESANARYDLGIALDKLGRYKESIETLKDALQSNPNHKEAGNALAYVEKKMQQPKFPPNLTTSVSFKDPKGKGMLEAGDTGKVIITIKNSGKGRAYDVSLKLEPLKEIAHLRIKPTNLKAGDIEPGDEKKVESDITADEDIATQEVKMRIEGYEANGFAIDPLNLTFNTRELYPPDLKIVGSGIDDSSGNGMIEPGEVVEITARLQNRGQGLAKGINAKLKRGENVFLAGDSKDEFYIGDLESGAYKDIKFSIYTNKMATAVPVTIDLAEARVKFSKKEPLNFALNKPERLTQNIVVQAKNDEPKNPIKDAPPVKIGNQAKRDEPNPPEDASRWTEESIDVDTPTKTLMFSPNAIAVVIGNKDYQNKDVLPVDFAIKDAEVVKKYLIKTLGFKEPNIIYKPNATFADFNDIFGAKDNYKGRLYDYAKPNKSEIFIYYSGHGAPDVKEKMGYFLPVDANPDKVRLNGYSLEIFYENLYEIAKEKNLNKFTIVLDACFSGGIKNASPINLELRNPLIKVPGAIVFTSAKSNQISSWFPEKRHSLFTYFFLKGMQGMADLNNDKKLSVDEMEKFLSDPTEGVPYYARSLNSGREQIPEVFGNRKTVIVHY